MRENRHDKTPLADGDSRKPNGYSSLGMHGNVFEWCQDWYASDYYQQFKSETAVDPSGPSQATCRVSRGGIFPYAARRCKSSYRGETVPTARFIAQGFRVARSLPGK